tara:strand:+ start:345260 stop:345427 length:168 start_codon:yes stop_codon:yes gene_type:complete
MGIDKIISSLGPVITAGATAGGAVAAAAGVAVATPAIIGGGICVIAYGVIKATKK